MRELLKEFFQYLGTLLYEIYYAPKEQALDAFWSFVALAFQLLILFVVFCIVKKMFKKLL